MGTYGLSCEHSIEVRATPERVLRAFFDPRDIGHWWQAARSVTVPRPLGTYAVEWPPSEHRDLLLGRLGGAFHGTVMEYRPGAECFVADAYWSPPEGDPVGPMAMEIRCQPGQDEGVTRLTVRQSAEDEGPRWRRYFELVDKEWLRTLPDLKYHIEAEAELAVRQS